MPLELVETLFSAIKEEQGNLINTDNLMILTANYSEVLLYKHFEGMLELARKYNLRLHILTHGTPLTPEKMDILLKYPDVLNALVLNVPAFDAATWSEYTGFPIKKFDTLISNITLAEQKFSYLGKSLKFCINGIGDDAHQKQIENAKTMFPKFDILVNHVQNRGGKLKDVIDGSVLDEGKVVGCGDFVDRIYESMHINALGEFFICCNDYDYDYVFGDIKTSTISEIWGSEAHIDTIRKAFNGICRSCRFAIEKS